MSDKRFDVVVLGRSLSAMSTAALLARRDFSVLVIGNGARNASYTFQGHSLRRRAFTPLAASSPAFKRIMTELAQSQVIRRRLAPLDPMLTVLLPDRRFELPPDLKYFQREVEREFPEARRTIDDLYVDLTRVNAAADAAFEHDVCWPPGTFWERRETASAASQLPYVHTQRSPHPLAGFPPNHPYADIVVQSAGFASYLASHNRALPAFALARLHGAWTRGPFGLAAGEDDIIAFLTERIGTMGGRVLLDERAVGLKVRKSGGHEVIVDGLDAAIGADVIVSDVTGEGIAALARGEGLTKQAQARWPQVTEPAGRYVMSLVVRSDGLPESLGAEALVFPSMPGAPTDPLLPVVRLQRLDRARSAEDSSESDSHALLVAEVLLLAGGRLSLREARGIVLDIILAQLPFLRDYLVLVDSVNDGLPVWTFHDGQRRDVDRMEIQAGGASREPMTPLLSIDPMGYLGLCGEPLRGPIPDSYLCGPSVIPALGQEGELLAALGVARIVGKSNKRRARLRRDMWSRIELG